MADSIDRILALIDEGLLEHPTQRSEEFDPAVGLRPRFSDSEPRSVYVPAILTHEDDVRLLRSRGWSHVDIQSLDRAQLVAITNTLRRRPPPNDTPLTA